jgi:RNA polymerase sigma-70 factor (ECF subfamily)
MSIGSDKTESDSVVSSTSALAESSDIAAARTGDEEAFRRIVERYQSTLANQLRRFSPNPSVVEDLVHDTFVEAFLSLSSFKGKSPFEHWLRKLAVRSGYRYWKKNAREQKLKEKLHDEPATLSGCSEDPASAVDANEQLHAMMSKLTPRDRLVLTLLYWDDRSVAEAAELAGWTQSMVKVQAYRARNRLKKLLEENS